jgi:hypothetical protein
MTIYLLRRPKIANTRNIEFAVMAPNDASLPRLESAAVVAASGTSGLLPRAGTVCGF